MRQTDEQRERAIEGIYAKMQDDYWGGEPDGDQDEGRLRDALDDALREAMRARTDLGKARLALSAARHTLRRAEVVLRGEAARARSYVLLAVADECRNALEDRTS